MTKVTSFRLRYILRINERDDTEFNHCAQPTAVWRQVSISRVSPAEAGAKRSAIAPDKRNAVRGNEPKIQIPFFRFGFAGCPQSQTEKEGGRCGVGSTQGGVLSGLAGLLSYSPFGALEAPGNSNASEQIQRDGEAAA